MLIGKVTGSVWATRKDEKLNGLKFLVVKLNPTYGISGSTLVAADNAGAGVGDTVLITTGSSARCSFQENITIPVDATIVGIIDSIEVE